jgi:hypothetical protein
MVVYVICSVVLLGVIVFLGWCIGYATGVTDIYTEAIKNSCGRYEADPGTGKVRFKWKGTP